MQMEVLDLETELFFDDFVRQYFVETIASQAPYKILMMNRLVFLTGQPGVGKTETSRYLGFCFQIDLIHRHLLFKEVLMMWMRWLDYIVQLTRMRMQSYWLFSMIFRAKYF